MASAVSWCFGVWQATSIQEKIRVKNALYDDLEVHGIVKNCDESGD
jgi:hypothetical protein